MSFTGSLKALGILIDLSEVKLLKVRFSNTDERCFEATHDIKAILKSGKLNRSEGQRIRGRLLFAESQIHGRRSIRQMQVLSKRIHKCSSVALDKETRGAFEFLCNKLEVGQARCISPLACHATEVIHLYCDASCEPDNRSPAGFGCVLVDPDSNFRCHISEFLGQELIASWNFAGSKHPIYEFELVAVLMGIKLLASFLRYKAVIVDNEGALGSLISCKSENIFGQKLVELTCDLEESSHAFFWYERVDAASNIADVPSRDHSL